MYLENNLLKKIGKVLFSFQLLAIKPSAISFLLFIQFNLLEKMLCLNM